MKKIFSIVAILAVSIALFSCGDKKTGVCIYQGLKLRQEAGGAAIYDIEHGEEVTILSEELSEIANSNGKKTPYINVKTAKGKKGWCNSFFIVNDASAAVITAETTIYDKDKTTSMTSRKLQTMQIIAVRNEKDPENPSDFYDVVWNEFSGSKKEWTTPADDKFIKKANVSFDAKDVKAARFYHTAMEKTDEDMKKNMLEEAEKVGSRAFAEQIAEALAVFNPVVEEETTDDTADDEVIDIEPAGDDEPVGYETIDVEDDSTDDSSDDTIIEEIPVE